MQTRSRRSLLPPIESTKRKSKAKKVKTNISLESFPEEASSSIVQFPLLDSQPSLNSEKLPGMSDDSNSLPKSNENVVGENKVNDTTSILELDPAKENSPTPLSIKSNSTYSSESHHSPNFSNQRVRKVSASDIGASDAHIYITDDPITIVEGSKKRKKVDVFIDLTQNSSFPVIIQEDSTKEKNPAVIDITSSSSSSGQIIDLLDSPPSFSSSPTISKRTELSIIESLGNPPAEKITPSISFKCSICLEQPEQLASTNCGHIFCTQCIQQVINSSKKCPVCRKKLTKKGYHPLYI